MFFLQTLFFAAVAFGLGCLFGCWLKGRLRTPRHHSGAAGAITHAGAARTSTAGELASSRPHYEPVSRAQREEDLPPRPVAAPVPAVAPQAGAVAPATIAPVVPDEPAAASKPAARKAAAAKAAKAKSAAAPEAPKPAAAKPRTAKAAEAKPAAARAKTAKARPKAASSPDNLKQIKGVGPQIEAKLNAAGINSFAQIAAWTKTDQARFGEQLSFAGRIEREDWVSQAKILAKGGSTEFAQRVAKGEVESSAGKPGRGGKS